MQTAAVQENAAPKKIEMPPLLTVSPSPHIRGPENIASIMLDAVGCVCVWCPGAGTGGNLRALCGRLGSAGTGGTEKNSDDTGSFGSGNGSASSHESAGFCAALGTDCRYIYCHCGCEAAVRRDRQEFCQSGAGSQSISVYFFCVPYESVSRCRQ